MREQVRKWAIKIVAKQMYLQAYTNHGFWRHIFPTHLLTVRQSYAMVFDSIAEAEVVRKDAGFKNKEVLYVPIVYTKKESV